MINYSIPGHSTSTQKQFILGVECKEKAGSKCEIIGEGGIEHNDIPIVLLEADTALEGKILQEDAVLGCDLGFIVRVKQPSIHPVVSEES